MSDVTASVPNVCVTWECERPATHGVYCAKHAVGASGAPGKAEPALEARLAAMSDPPEPEPEQPPMLDVGDRPVVRPRVVPSEVNTPERADEHWAYVAEALNGEHGAMRKAMAEAMVKTVAEGLRSL